MVKNTADGDSRECDEVARNDSAQTDGDRMNEKNGVPRSEEVVGGDGVNMMPALTGRVLARLEMVLKLAMAAKSFNRQLWREWDDEHDECGGG